MKLSRSLTLPTLLLIMLSVLTTAKSYSSPVDRLQPVGSTTLKVLLWTIYHSTLFTDDGEYRGIEPGLALQIDYRRNIKSEKLISTTRDQWQKLALYDPDTSESWLVELASLWPDIRRGDSITLYVEPDLSATFFYNGESLGQLNDAGFTAAFLAIWLDENSTFPELRNELVGLN